MRGSKFILYWFASYKWNILCYHLQLGRHCAPHQHYQHLCLASFLIRIPPTCCPAPCPAADQPHSNFSGSLWDWSVYTPMPPSMRIVPHNLCSSHCHRTGCRSTVKTNSSQMYIVTSNQTRCTQTMHQTILNKSRVFVWENSSICQQNLRLVNVVTKKLREMRKSQLWIWQRLAVDNSIINTPMDCGSLGGLVLVSINIACLNLIYVSQCNSQTDPPGRGSEF
mgnify:CR=1 FL=1